MQTLSGWLLILALLILGGVLAVVGDQLGTSIGKARLSLLGMRPRRTAVVFTAITGSVIASVSFAFLVAVNARWRRGLFELGQIEKTLRRTRDELTSSQEQLVQANQSRNAAEVRAQALSGRTASLQAKADGLRTTIKQLGEQRQQLLAEQHVLIAEVRRRDDELNELQGQIENQTKELRNLKRNFTALRRGDVAIASNEPLAMAKVKLPGPDQVQEAIDNLLNRANQVAYERLLPGQQPRRPLIRISTSEVDRLSRYLQTGQPWLVSIRSAANVLLGEDSLLTFVDVRPNRLVLRAGQVLATTVVEPDERSEDALSQRFSLLLATARNEAVNQGAVNGQINVDNDALAALGRDLMQRETPEATLVAFSVDDRETGDPLRLEVRWVDEAPVDEAEARAEPE